ncbi:hypothetical protein BDZ97DRAFT_1767232 [Flammula alnicola]|nr:hypothetical protein BDZ97DRAFT_1767232 [Flammula alnicola]
MPRTRFNAPIPSVTLANSRAKPYRVGLVPAHLRGGLTVLRATGCVCGFLCLPQQVLGAWAPGTKGAYSAGLLVFHVFCDTKRPPVPEHLRGPASDLLVLEFMSCCAGTLRGTTLRNYTYGIKAWHTVHGLGWVLDDTRIKAALAAAERVAPVESKRPKRPPLLVATISAIRDNLDITQPLDAAVFACLTTTFWAAARLGEFTVPSLKGFDPTIHVKLSNVSVSTGELPVTTLHIPWTKVAKFEGEDVHWAPQGVCDPDAAFKNHLAVNAPAPDVHLFSYRHTDGRVRPMTRTNFLRRLNSAMAGVEGWIAFQGHSIRIGSVLEYLLRGVSFEVVKTHGRWSSDAFLLYLRRHADILAPYIQDSPVLEAFWRRTMPPVLFSAQRCISRSKTGGRRRLLTSARTLGPVLSPKKPWYSYHTNIYATGLLMACSLVYVYLWRDHSPDLASSTS